VATSAAVSGGISLRVPGVLAYRHLAIRLVSTACKICVEKGSFAGRALRPSEFETEVISASGEAFNNIAIHGFCGIEPTLVSIDVEWDAERMTITFVDEGKVFDPEAVAPPNLDDLPERGMGLYIMRTFMDEVDYCPGPPNVLRLVKNRPLRR
jgi:serine/threonine-protein kinase RsbW